MGHHFLSPSHGSGQGHPCNLIIQPSQFLMLHNSTPRTEAAYSSRMLVSAYKTTWCYNPKGHSIKEHLTAVMIYNLRLQNPLICQYKLKFSMFQSRLGTTTKQFSFIHRSYGDLSASQSVLFLAAPTFHWTTPG
jgi:hypothetical protein